MHASLSRVVRTMWSMWSITGGKRGPSLISLSLQEPQRVVLEHYLAALVDHPVREAHQAAVTLGGQAMLGDFGLDVQRIADQRRRLHIDGGAEEGEPGVLHRRQQQPLGKGIDQSARHRAALDRARRIVRGVFLDREQLLREPGEVDERGEIGFDDGAPVGAEAEADAQVLEREPSSDNRDRFAHTAGTAPLTSCRTWSAPG